MKAPSQSPPGRSGGDQPSSQDIELATSMGAAINRLVKMLRRHTRNAEMLSLTQRATLGQLHKEGRLLPSELAQLEKVTTQSMSQVINHLHKLDFVLKTPSESDKRKIFLSLTEKGRAYVEQLREEKHAWLSQRMHERLSGEDKQTLTAAVTILTRLIDE